MPIDLTGGAMLVLDSGAISALARRDEDAATAIRRLRRHGHWPPVVPTVVMIESLTGSATRDANANWLLKGCDLRPHVPEHVARRAAHLRTAAKTGSAVDALLVAMAEPGGVVLTSDPRDLAALAANSAGVFVETI